MVGSGRPEAQLRKSERQFRALFDRAAVGMALVNLKGQPFRSNRKLQHMLGYSAEELRRTPFPKFTHVEDVDLDWGLFSELMSGRRDHYKIEKRFIHKDGRLVWGYLTVSLVRNDQGIPEFVIGVVEDITEKKEAREELAVLSARMTRLQEEERRRIALELHDGVGQAMVALIYHLGSIDSASKNLEDPLRRKLRDTLELAKQTARELRSISYLLHPPMLNEFGLRDTVEWYVTGFIERTGIQVDLRLPSRKTRFGNDIEVGLFRIVQEGLGNIFKHSGSKRAEVRISRSRYNLTLTIRDFGRGIKAASQGSRSTPFEGGMGIPGMKERVAQMRGELNICSTSNGTSVTAIIPLSARHSR